MQALWVIIGLLFTYDGLGLPLLKDIFVLSTVLVLAGILLLVSTLSITSSSNFEAIRTCLPEYSQFFDVVTCTIA